MKLSGKVVSFTNSIKKLNQKHFQVIHLIAEHSLLHQFCIVKLHSDVRVLTQFDTRRRKKEGRNNPYLASARMNGPICLNFGCCPVVNYG